MMKQRIFSLFLAVMMIFSSIEMPVFAEETEREEAILEMPVFAEETKREEVIQLQTSETLTDESHVTESTRETWEEERISEETVTETVSSDSADEEISESAITDRIEETSQEQNTFETESLELEIDSQLVNDTEMQEESSLTESESIEIGNEMTETNTTLLETGQEETTIDQETTEPEEIETEEDEIKAESSSGLNEAVKSKILSFKGKYPNESVWKGSHGGGIQCYGFALLMADEVFGAYPEGLRLAQDGKESKGWKCYYVTPNNCNTLSVEPGDIIDAPSPHSAMVLSVSGKNIICVQCNYGREVNGNLINDYKVYWGDEYNNYYRFFNYNTKRATLEGICNEYYSRGTIRLWKPSDTLKMNATGFNPGPSTLGIKEASKPTTIIQGSSWACKGTIQSNYPLEHIGGYILASDGTTVLYSKTVENTGITNYSLEGSEISKALPFDKLPTGTYWYHLTAHDTSGKREYLIKKQFTVIAKDTPSTLSVRDASYPTSIQQGSNWLCKGMISSNYELQHIGGYILGSDGVTIMYSKSVDNLEATSFSLEDSEIAKALKFNELAAGTYWYHLTAHDISGKRLYLIKQEFTVLGRDTSSTLQISGASSPQNIYQGTDWTCKGEISSNYSLEHVAGYILESDGKTIIYSKVLENLNTTNFTLEGSEIDQALSFDKLSEGVYWYQITAHDASGQRSYLINTQFQVTTIQDEAVPTVTQIDVDNWELTSGKDEFVFRAKIDEVVPKSNIWVIVRDEKGQEKRFEPETVEQSENGVECFGCWSDISGLELDGVYTLTVYAQDNAGNIGFASKEVIISNISSNLEKVNLTVGESTEVDITVETFFQIREKGFSDSSEELQLSSDGLKTIVQGLKPGSKKFSFWWRGQNEAVSIHKSYDMYAYIVPKAPIITKVFSDNNGYDIITYNSVEYAETYELYRMRVGVDREYQLYEEFVDNNSHTLIVEQSDQDIIYSYKLRAKAAETIDVCTNVSYCPTSDFSNAMTGKDQEDSSEEESSENQESSEEESSSIEESSEEESQPTDTNIKDGLYIVGLKDQVYTGSAIKQRIKVYYNKILLTEGKDYKLAYKNNVKTGTAKLIIKAKGNLIGTVIQDFEIKPRDITDKNVIVEDTVYTFDNKMHKKAPSIIYQGKALKQGKDYIVTDYGKGDYRSIGIYTIKIKGIGNFTGNYDLAKVIITEQNKNISKAAVAKIPVQQYHNGKAVELPDNMIKVTLDKNELKKDIDYTVGYADNMKPGKATLIIRGIGVYAGTKKVTYNIKKAPVTITESMVVNSKSIASAEIIKGGASPQPLLKSDGYTLQKDIDYTLSYKNNKKAGASALIVIKGKGSFKGSIKLRFMVETKSINSPDITIRVPDVPNMGKTNQYQSKPIIIDKDGKELTLNRDYAIGSYQVDNTDLDHPKITVTIYGKGNYTGTATRIYEMRGTKFSPIIKINAKVYTGKAVTIEAKDILSASIKIGKEKKTLIYGKDYEIVGYKNNIKRVQRL